MQKNHRPSSNAPRRKLALCSIFALLALLGTGTFFFFKPMAIAKESPKGPTAPPPMPVEVTEVAIADAEQQLRAVGTLQSNESVVISAEIAGRIDNIAFAEGEETARGKVLIGLDASIPRAELDRAEASRALSEANYKRAEALLKDKAIAQRERDEAYAQWQLDEASLRLAKAQLDKARIAAPFSGTLGLRNVSLGDYVQPGQPLVNLEDITKLKVEFRISERFSTQVKVGQQISLQSDAFPAREFAGQVYAIAPQVEANSRSLVIRALLDNRDGALRPGQFVKVCHPGRRPVYPRTGPDHPTQNQPGLQGRRRQGADGSGADRGASQGLGRGHLGAERRGCGHHRRPPEDRPGQPGAADAGGPSVVCKNRLNRMNRWGVPLGCPKQKPVGAPLVGAQDGYQGRHKTCPYEGNTPCNSQK